MNSTVELMIAQSRSIVFPGTIETIAVLPSTKLFGTWIGIGNEDEDLEELYKSRKG